MSSSYTRIEPLLNPMRAESRWHDWRGWILLLRCFRIELLACLFLSLTISVDVSLNRDRIEARLVRPTSYKCTVEPRSIGPDDQWPSRVVGLTAQKTFTTILRLKENGKWCTKWDANSAETITKLYWFSTERNILLNYLPLESLKHTWYKLQLHASLINVVPF
jgi:hypothetical protein